MINLRFYSSIKLKAGLMFLAGFLFVTSPVFGNNSSKYSFILKVTDRPNDTAIIGYYSGPTQYVLDTVYTNKKGVIKYSTNEKLDGGLYLLAFIGDGYFEFVINPNESGFSIETKLEAPVENMVVKNSYENTVFNQFQKVRKKQGEELDPLYERLKDESLSKNEKQTLSKEIEAKIKEHMAEQVAYANNHKATVTALLINLLRPINVPQEIELTDLGNNAFLYTKIHFWDFVNFNDICLLRTPLYKTKVFRFLGPEFTPQHPDSISFWAAKLLDNIYENGDKKVFKTTLNWIGGKYENSKRMTDINVFTFLLDRYYLTNKVTWLNDDEKGQLKLRYIRSINNLVGKKAPNLVMLDTAKIPRALHFEDSPFTLIYFYSTNCAHCKEMTPKILAIYNEYKEKGFNVFGVCTDYEEVLDDNGNISGFKVAPSWPKYIKENKLRWTNVSDPSNQTGFRDLYDVYNTPVIYLLDSNKNIIGRRIDDIVLRRFLLHEIDGFSHQEAQQILLQKGYLKPEEKE
ncbi:MAG: TlpA family protein disulfide reductase [Bacteroidetes bacterium]|nr:TlpA family protein disulfide reductase [Bacteroidota bacterium]